MTDKKEKVDFNWQNDGTPNFEPATPAFNGMPVEEDSKGIDNYRNFKSNY